MEISGFKTLKNSVSYSFPLPIVLSPLLKQSDHENNTIYTFGALLVTMAG